MQDGLARQLEDKLAPRLHVLLASSYRYLSEGVFLSQFSHAQA